MHYIHAALINSTEALINQTFQFLWSISILPKCVSFLRYISISISFLMKNRWNLVQFQNLKSRYTLSETLCACHFIAFASLKDFWSVEILKIQTIKQKFCVKASAFLIFSLYRVWLHFHDFLFRPNSHEALKMNSRRVRMQTLWGNDFDSPKKYAHYALTFAFPFLTSAQCFSARKVRFFWNH